MRALRDVTGEQLNEYRHVLHESEFRRSRHVVSECERVLQFVQALANNDLEYLGRLMTASHESLRDDFEVSCVELDAVVDIALGVTGVYGARMTGAGFGGCAVMLVRDTAVADLTEAIETTYFERTGLTPEIYTFRAADGVRRL